MTLQFRAKHDQPMPGKFGAYQGRGDGQIEGPRLTGEVVWDLYENQAASACEANLVGTIRTSDDAEINFDVLGFFTRVGGASTWSLISAVRFTSDEQRYARFDDCVGVIVGSFDMDAYTHRYRVLAPSYGA